MAEQIRLTPATSNPLTRLRYTDDDGTAFYFKEGVSQVQAEDAVKGYKSTGILPPYATINPPMTKWEGALDFMNQAGEYILPTPQTPTEAALMATMLGLSAVPGGSVAGKAVGGVIRRIGVVGGVGAVSGTLDPSETLVSGAAKGIAGQAFGESVGYLTNRITRVVADKFIKKKGTEGAVAWFDETTELLKKHGDPTKSTDILYRKLYVDATQEAAHQIYGDTLTQVARLAPKAVQSEYADNLAKLVGYVPEPIYRPTKGGGPNVWRPDDILEMFSLAGRFGFKEGAAKDTRLANQIIQNRDLLLKELERAWPKPAMELWGQAREQYKVYSSTMKAFQSAGENLFKPDGSLNLDTLRTSIVQNLTPQERAHLGGHLGKLFDVFLRGTQNFAQRDVPGGWGTNPHFWLGRGLAVPGFAVGLPTTPVRVGSQLPEQLGRASRIPATVGFQDILNLGREE